MLFYWLDSNNKEHALDIVPFSAKKRPMALLLWSVMVKTK